MSGSVGTKFCLKEALDLQQVGQFYRQIIKDTEYVYLIRAFFHTGNIMFILYEMGVVSTMDNDIKKIIKNGQRLSLDHGHWHL